MMAVGIHIPDAVDIYFDVVEKSVGVKDQIRLHHQSSVILSRKVYGLCNGI